MKNDIEWILPREFKYFEAARKAALNSTFKTHVGAVAIYHGRIIASAASLDKTHPLQKKWNKYRDNFSEACVYLPKVHAEIGLLAKLKKLDISIKDVRIYIYRTCKSRDHGMARPCNACLQALIAVGIRLIYYTTDIGYAKEWIDCRINKEACIR